MYVNYFSFIRPFRDMKEVCKEGGFVVCYAIFLCSIMFLLLQCEMFLTL